MTSTMLSSRYNSFDSRSSIQSHQSDPSSSSTEFPKKKQSRALVKAKSADVATLRPRADNNNNLSAMVKKFMERRSSSSTSSKAAKNGAGLAVPAGFIAEDLKKTARKGSNFGGLQRKLFSKGSSGLGVNKEASVRKALIEVKSNTRTLAMVLRSERELLSLNKEQEDEIAELKLILEEKNSEVEKLKDLCLKQREEIKSLKSAVLFPDVMNSQLQELLQKQDSELMQAKPLIQNLQRQVNSLTGQLQYLAEGLAEVKADKHSMKRCHDGHVSSPRTQAYDQEDSANSLEFSFGDQTTPGSPDDMFLNDLNPCLTPYYTTTKSKEFEVVSYESTHGGRDSKSSLQMHENDVNSQASKVSDSSDYFQCSHSHGSTTSSARRSN